VVVLGLHIPVANSRRDLVYFGKCYRFGRPRWVWRPRHTRRNRPREFLTSTPGTQRANTCLSNWLKEIDNRRNSSIAPRRRACCRG